MSLLQSNLRRTESALLVGCCMIASAGCSFDSAPQTGGRTDSMSSGAWKPPGATRAGTSGSELDGSPDPDKTMSARAESAGNGSETMRPTAADAGAPAADAGAKSARPDQAGRGTEAGEMLPAQDAAPRPTTPPQPQQTPDASTTTPTTTPTAPARCRPGVYTGTFSGSLQLIGLSLSPVTGTVRAELVADASAEHLDMRDGHVVGVDQDGNRLTCGLAGRINCADFQFVEGRLTDGLFHNLDSNSDTAFTGSAQATYSQEPHSLVGTWQVEATDTSLLGGRGTWNLLFSE